MKSINDILDIRLTHILNVQQDENMIPAHIRNLSKKRISTLNDIRDKIDIVPGLREPAEDAMKITHLKFIELCEIGLSLHNKFDKREIRILSYVLNYKDSNTLSIFENEFYLRPYLSLLNNNWRDSFIKRLLDCYLFNWGSEKRSSLNILSSFLLNKISVYQGTRKDLRTLQLNLKFLDKDRGDLDLGATLALSSKSLLEGTKFLLLQDHYYSYSYFTGVINGFLEKSKNRLDLVLDDIANALERHSSKTRGTQANKLIVSKIIRLTNTSSELVQNRVKDIAFKLVGDPANSNDWRPYSGASDVDVSIINHGRKILNEWVTRQFINVFFEKCINDKRRKLFWLKYSRKISAFKVFGPRHVRAILNNDPRISEYVHTRFQSINSKRNVSAFMFVMGKYKMIEFSDPGFAFYAYSISNTYAPSIDQNNIHSISYFVNGSMPYLVRNDGTFFYDHHDEGRLSHADTTVRWEEKFENWIKIKAGISV